MTGEVTTVTTGPQLDITAYGIRDKGGVVPITVSSTGGLNVTANGVKAEIGEIDIARRRPAGSSGDRPQHRPSGAGC